jgi:prephenate dehydratase
VVARESLTVWMNCAVWSDAQRRTHLFGVRARQKHRPLAIREKLSGDSGALSRGFSGCVDRLWHTLPKASVMVDSSESEIGKGPARELCEGILGIDGPVLQVLDQFGQFSNVHQAHYPASMDRTTEQLGRIAYLGPRGTFSEEALLGEVDLADAELVATATIPDAIALVASGDADAAFVPFENAIEGSVNLTLDQLVFDVDLFIQREVVLEVHMDLLARSGETLDSIQRILSFPFATAQVRGYLAQHLSHASIEPTNSTADGARILSDPSTDASHTAAVAPPLTAKIYGLDVLAHAIEDHKGNQTRFLLVARDGVPAPTGRDRTTIACFQRSDRPGSLYEILRAFSSRGLNLTRIESRPTRRGLGDYCFVIEFEGHLQDPATGECLCELVDGGVSVKFLGSYPVHGGAPAAKEPQEDVLTLNAREWLAALRSKGPRGA